jgi:hypothetical protein
MRAPSALEEEDPHMAERKTTAAPKPAEIVLQRIGRCLIEIPIVGTAPLIVNKFSKKAADMMLAKQMGQAIQRPPKDPEELFNGARHRMADRDGLECDGFPAPGFKASLVNAARFFKGSKLTMEMLKQAIFVMGEGPDMLVPLLAAVTDDNDEMLKDPVPAVPEMRQDHVRNETGVADIRFRPVYQPWAAVLRVVYIKNMLTPDSVLALADAAGNVGTGEWRPASKESKTGTYGTFMVPAGFSVATVVDL